ncbi:uncharacterized protein EI90DRAFT_3129601 [Cantharellus anzutake]|uniref:uncharacterized protein n=1 Tax=Cantharellus anzutake TaxID=1750568 RepID=UPI00190587F7|nr:uncharacterized protein EI90DRAFT_3129601 [Cantharellus anzutake]KAF8324667.1 hypothetical protein EI90DRAFT_3129601 [Cantharellus anzutake]
MTGTDGPLIFDSPWDTLGGYLDKSLTETMPEHGEWVEGESNTCRRLWLSLSDSVQVAGASAEYYTRIKHGDAKISDYESIPDYISGLMNLAHEVNKRVPGNRGRIEDQMIAMQPIHSLPSCMNTLQTMLVQNAPAATNNIDRDLNKLRKEVLDTYTLGNTLSANASAMATSSSITFQQVTRWLTFSLRDSRWLNMTNLRRTWVLSMLIIVDGHYPRPQRVTEFGEGGSSREFDCRVLAGVKTEVIVETAGGWGPASGPECMVVTAGFDLQPLVPTASPFGPQQTASQAQLKPNASSAKAGPHRSRAKANKYKKLGIIKTEFLMKPNAESLPARYDRLKKVESNFSREAIHHAENNVDNVILEAMKNTVRVDIDYAEVAVHNDKATNDNGSQEKMMRLSLPTVPEGQDIVLNYAQGAAIEDKNGTLLAIRLPHALDYVHDATVKASEKFNKEFKFQESDFRPHFKKKSLFKSGQAHFAYWQGVGGYRNFPTVSHDAQVCKKTVREFHRECEPVYHTTNIYMERLAPELAKSGQEVWNHVRQFRDKEKDLQAVKSHFVSHAVIFNSDEDYHKDTNSCWSGFDAVAVLGEYEGGLLHFPELGYSFPSRPGDLFFIRGAAFTHSARGWEGAG